jgi:hypothetical protein
MNPWEPQPGESALAYARFIAYRDLGFGRSVEAAWRGANPNRAGGRPPGCWFRQCKRWNWPQRAARWDIDRMQKQGEARRQERFKRTVQAGLAALVNLLQRKRRR